MLSNFHILTVTHKHTDLKMIGDFVIDNSSDDHKLSKLQALKEKFDIQELMYLATCNRVMFFFYKDKIQADSSFVQQFFNSINQHLSSLNGSLNQHVQTYQGEQAIKHLLEVASSIDSMVVGEREILRQLRLAYEFSNKNGLCGDKMRIAMHCAVKSAKEVYGATAIGEKPVSVVSLAIQELLKLSPARDSRILMIGAGQTHILVTKFLKKHGFSDLKVYNRSLAKAQKLAMSMNGSADTLDQLPNYKRGFDILFVCTAATESIINANQYESLLNGETARKIIIDLAVPRNVGQEVIDNHAVNYIEVDSLKELADQNMAFRQNEIHKVKGILDKQLDEFKVLYQERAIEKALSHVPVEIKAIKEKAMKEVFSKDLEKLDPDTLRLIDEMMTYMEKKCIAVPIKNAKKNL